MQVMCGSVEVGGNGIGGDKVWWMCSVEEVAHNPPLQSGFETLNRFDCLKDEEQGDEGEECQNCESWPVGGKGGKVSKVVKGKVGKWGRRQKFKKFDLDEDVWVSPGIVGQEIEENPDDRGAW